MDAAVSAAGDIGKLADLRAGLRQRFETSPNQDVVLFTRTLEAAYLDMARKRQW